MATVSTTSLSIPVWDDSRHLDEIIRNRAVRALYQPIVELDTGRVIGWESLARGPRASPLELPGALFAEAARAGRTAELDHCCRLAAIDGAIKAGLGRDQELFMNIEPDVAGASIPPYLSRALERAQTQLRVTVEITERDLVAAPADLIALVEMYRSWGWGIALDDVGVDARSIALMPLIRPDVIKLDMMFLHEPITRSRARVVHAVLAEAERSGAAVLAEGIENAEGLAIARALGATLGQGWLFGRPDDLRPAAETEGTGRTRIGIDPALDTPFEFVSGRRPLRIGTKQQLLQMSLALEESVLNQGASAVLLATFQEPAYFPNSTGARYTSFAEHAAFVGALAHGLGNAPAKGVRGSALEATDPIRGEWDVVVLGPHFAGAFVARDLGDRGPEAERRFDYAITYDRDLVVGVATRLMRRIAASRSH
jgi:EAL domain-containing protein (putative c-di-GMP-specific phosphodiesterase class I)